MTLKQVWRFLRDTHLVGASSTLAQFNRVYNRGTKNHFSLLGSTDKHKFDNIYCGAAKVPAPTGDAAVAVSNRNISDDEDDGEEQKDCCEEGAEVEDVHDALKIVLQRQFFEAVVRAAAVKFESGSGGEELHSLSLKLDHLFKNNFANLAVKNKSKTLEDEKAYRVAEKVFDDYTDPLKQAFDYFAKKTNSTKNGKKDQTLQVNELLDMLNKANFLDGKTTDLTLEEIINLIEKYYEPSATLKTKLSAEKFDTYCVANSHLIKSEANEGSA